jgi:biopolymer transport protein ExbB
MLTSLLLRMTYLGAEWILWVLLALSVISISLIVERVLYYRRTKVDGEQLASRLQELLKVRNLQGAWHLVKDTQSTVIEHAVVAAGLAAMRGGAHACSEAMLSAKARMKPELDSNLSILATIGSNAPFVGLLGTVLGIIKAAHEMNVAAGSNNPSAVMAGVFEALVATAVGLFVAIPAVVAFNIFERVVRTRMAQVDSLAHLVLSNAALLTTTAAPTAATQTAAPARPVAAPIQAAAAPIHVAPRAV